AVTLAQQSAHPFSLGFALGVAAVIHQLRREVSDVQEHAEATIRVAKNQGFPLWMAYGTMLYGWALAHQGQAQEGIEQITQGLTAYRATGAELARPWFLSLIAEAHGFLGELEAGLTALTEALTLVETTGGRWCESELYRLKGALLLQQHAANQADAEHCFPHPPSLARHPQGKSFQLRSAPSIAP